MRLLREHIGGFASPMCMVKPMAGGPPVTLMGDLPAIGSGL